MAANGDIMQVPNVQDYVRRANDYDPHFEHRLTYIAALQKHGSKWLPPPMLIVSDSCALLVGSLIRPPGLLHKTPGLVWHALSGARAVAEHQHPSNGQEPFAFTGFSP